MNRELEAMIDANGLDNVLSAMREICYAKANQIAVEWQDVAQAKQWLAYGVRVNSVVRSFRLHPSVRALRGVVEALSTP